MNVPWKLIGAAGLAGVAATGVVVARRRAQREDIDPDELRERLHRRLDETRTGQAPASSSASTRPSTS